MIAISQMDRSIPFSSVAQSCPTLCDLMDCSTPGLPVYHQLPELTQLMSIESVMPSNHLILCHPLLLPPSIFPSIRVFSNESVLLIRQPKYWSFSFSISPSNEHSGLISFRMDWLDLRAVQGTLKSLLQYQNVDSVTPLPDILHPAFFVILTIDYKYINMYSFTSYNASDLPIPPINYLGCFPFFSVAYLTLL